MSKSDVRIRGVYEIYYRLDTKYEINSISDIDVADAYCKVAQALPIAEFEYPSDLLAVLIDDKDRYGSCPRVIQRGDIIHINVFNKNLPSRVLLVVDPDEDYGLFEGEVRLQKSRASHLALLPTKLII